MSTGILFEQRSIVRKRLLMLGLAFFVTGSAVGIMLAVQGMELHAAGMTGFLFERWPRITIILSWILATSATVGGGWILRKLHSDYAFPEPLVRVTDEDITGPPMGWIRQSKASVTIPISEITEVELRKKDANPRLTVKSGNGEIVVFASDFGVARFTELVLVLRKTLGRAVDFKTI